MANAGPNTNGSQFFIDESPTLEPAKYTIFGQVKDGLDVVKAMAGATRDRERSAERAGED